MRISKAITVSGAVLCAAQLMSAADYEKILRHQFPTENPAKIIVEADVGDVQLIRSDSGVVAVDVILGISTSSRQQADRAFENIIAEFFEQDEGRVRINVRTTRSGLDWLKFWKKYPDVKIGILVPDGISIDLATGAGDVSGKDLISELQIATGAGDVGLENLKGSLDVATGAGDVELTGFNGEVSAATGAGDFQGTGNFNAFSINTGKGDVVLKVDNPVSQNSSINTGMGDIYVALPVGSQFQLAADVGLGSISTEFDIVDTDPDKKSFRGTYNEGSVQLNFSTGFGDFHLARQ